MLRLRPGELDPYVRAWWALDDGRVLELRDVRRFGRIGVVPVGEYASLPTLAAQGPEPWDEALDDGGLWQRHEAQPRPDQDAAAVTATDRRRRQHLRRRGPVAAGIHPARRSITRKEADRLLAELRVVLEQGIANGGTTLRDYRTPDGEPGRNQLELGAYGRAGEPCLRCGTELKRIVIDARGTTLLPDLPATRGDRSPAEDDVPTQVA